MASADAITHPRTDTYSSRLAKQFLQLRTDGDLTDITIRSEGTSFDCHKTILAANSPVLKAMMSTMSESSKREVTLHDIPPAVVQLLLNYMYTGDVNIPPEHLLDTVKACNFLQLVELKEFCLSQAVSVFKPSNIISWLKMADDLDMDELKSKCSDILFSSLADVCKEMEFLELSVAEVSSYITDAQETDVDSDDLLDATMGWVSHKPGQRLDCVEDLLLKIQLFHCSAECLRDEMEKHEALLDSRPAVYKILSKTLAETAVCGERRTKRRDKGKARMIVIGGQSTNDKIMNKLCWELDSSMQFVELCHIPECYLWNSVCGIPDGFALTGGRGSVLCTMFSASTNSWTQLEPLPVPRSEHGSTFLHDKIMVLGGRVRVSRNKSSSVQSLMLGEVKWRDEPELPINVQDPKVACVDASIFLLDGCTKQLLRLDTGAIAWVGRQKLPGKGCGGSQMTSVNGQLIVAGGSYKIFAQYSPSTDTWCTGNTPTLALSYGALVCLERKLYLLGGIYDDVEEYNLDTEAWAVCDFKIPKTLQNLCAIAL